MRSLKIKIAFVLLALFFCPFTQAQTYKKTFTLERDKPIKQKITAEEIHSYIIKTDKEQFLHIIVDQLSVDVVVSLFSSNGTKLLEIDNPNIKRGPEQIFTKTNAASTYYLEIKSKDTGRYEAKIESLRKAELPQDQNRIDAQRTFIEGEKLSASNEKTLALSKYEEALSLLDRPEDNFSKAEILYNLGKTHNSLGNPDEAADYFRRSLELFQTAGSWDEIFKDLNPLYIIMGGQQKTLDYLADAVPLVRALKNQRLEAILLLGLAKVSEDLNQTQKSLDYKSQALELLRITGKRGSEIFNMTEIADGDLSLEDKRKAIGYLNQAIMLSRGASDQAMEASLLFGIGYIYNSIDEPQNALKYFQQTLSLWHSLSDKNGEAYALNFIGIIYFQLGDYLLARDHFERSRILFREADDLRAEAQAISYLGVIENQYGDHQKAFDLYQKALKIFQDTGDKHSEASTLNDIAQFYWVNGDVRKALENYEKSLSIWQKTGFREGIANVLSNIGFVQHSLGNVELALENYNKALPTFQLLGDQSGEAVTLYGIARAMYAKGKKDESLAKIKTAIDLVETIRTRIAASDLRTTYLANYQHFYEFYIFLLMELHQAQPDKGFDALALQTSERAKARGLLDILNEAKADLRQGIKPDLLERERYLQKQLNSKALEKRRAKSEQEAESLDKEIRKLTADYRDLQAEIKSQSPRYAALTQPQPADLNNIQKMLDANTLLLEYSLGEEKSFLWIVSQSSIKSYVLPKRKEIIEKSRLFYESLKQPETQADAEKAAAELSKILIYPVAKELENKRLLIVADGVLQYIPFAALSAVNEQFLIQTNEIVYMPSASALAALREETKGREPAPKTVAIFADPVFSANDTRVNLQATNNSEANNEPNTKEMNSLLTQATRDSGFNNSVSLPRLPGTRREAAAISSLIPEPESKQAMDFDAKIEAIKSPQLAQFRIIHFATHGLLNSQHPELSGIVFSLVDETGKNQDGFLRLHEIYNLKLPADLVVLSACQTALGKEIKGEGLVGLTRGFMYAGSKRVVASLWAVDDRATSDLMKRFYQEMLGEKKLSPTAALRDAQIAMIKIRRFNAPYYWSAFTIQGEWQ